jgi:hypothetical protein
MAFVRQWLGAAHVFVFASFPFLSIYAANLPTFPMAPDLLLRPVAVISVVVVLLLVGLRLWTADLQQRAAALSLLLLGLTSFLFTATLGNGYWLRTGKPDWLLVLAHAVAGVSLAAQAREASRAHRLAVGLRIAAAALLLVTAVQMGLVAVQRPSWHAATDAIQAAGRIDIPAGGPRPDIVHLLLDGFGSPGVLRAFYDIDVTADLAFLEQRRFAIGQGVRANYPYTYSSVASMLNASYLDPLASFAFTADRRPLRHLIDTASVITALKGAGYRFTFISSSYTATDRHPLADRCDCDAIGLNEVETAVYRFSPLRLWTAEWLTYEPFRRKVRYELDAVRGIPDTGPPQYALAHLILPHPPFAFDENGQAPRTRRAMFGMPDGNEFPGSLADYESGYRAQARFALSQVRALVAHLQARARPTVIVISGDHGPGGRFDREDAGRSDVRERFNVFLAVYVPGRTATLPAEMTLVNVYRQVLRQALGARVDDLPDRSYFTGFSTPYRFQPVDVPPL